MDYITHGCHISQFTPLHISISFLTFVCPGRLNNPRLEAAYQKYSHRQRQKSVILVNLIDCALKLVTLAMLLFNEDTPDYSTIIGLSVSLSLNMILSILPCYSRYLLKSNAYTMKS